MTQQNTETATDVTLDDLTAGTAAMNAENAALEPKTPAQIAERFYYQNAAFPYLMDTGKGFTALKERACLRHAERMGLEQKEQKTFLCDVESRHHVQQSFDLLAGYDYGFYLNGGISFIVRNSAPWIEGKPGLFPITLELLQAILDDPNNPDQFLCFVACLQGARQRIRESRAGNIQTRIQHIVIAGDHDTGKTFLMKAIIAPLIATPPGRMYPGEKYFAKDGKFNGGMERYPGILLDDTIKNAKTAARWDILTKSKNILYADSVALEGKGRDCFSMILPWTVWQLMNADEESLTAFPLTGADTDKLCGFLAGSYHDMPRQNRTTEERRALDAAIASELEALAYWVDTFPIPDYLQEETRRHRCRAYVHPTLAEAVTQISPEAHLLELIDTAARKAYAMDDAKAIYTPNQTATAIWDAVQKNLPDTHTRAFLSIAKTARQLGVKLKKLTELYPARVAADWNAGKKAFNYTITPPAA